jgi:hypothetical protein
MTDKRWAAALEQRLSVLRDTRMVEIWLPASQELVNELVDLSGSTETELPWLELEIVVRRATVIVRFMFGPPDHGQAEDVLRRWLR